MVKFTLDTDDSNKIDKYVDTFDKAVNKGENIYIPKGTVEHEIISIPSNATLNPLPWIQTLNNFFFQSVSVPQVIVGSSEEITEAAGKIVYLAFEQNVKEWILQIESQIGAQLGIEVKYIFPASLENELLSGISKEETMQASTPEDTTVQDIGVNNATQTGTRT